MTRDQVALRAAFAAAAAVGLGMYLVSSTGLPGRKGGSAAGSMEPAPEFALPGLDGGAVRLSDFEGKVVLLDFWATWCPQCLDELADLEAVHRKLSGRGFTLLGVDLDPASDKAAVLAVARKAGLTYPVALAGGERVPGYDIGGLPLAHLLDRQGRIVKTYFGPKDPALLEADVSALLGAPAN